MARNDRHLVVDGSNIATEGRSLPSLAQLDEAVRAIGAEFPYSSLTVIVDATFAHRIDESERDEFEAAVSAGEIVTPPAGAVGRGDAFILQVADKAGAVVLSNDSYQEFHGEHDWLFEQGRLIGGKPIEGVGWVFVERVPVRGPASRRSTRGGVKSASGSSKRTRTTRTASAAATGPAPVPSRSTPPPVAKRAAPRSRQVASSPERPPTAPRVASRRPATAGTATAAPAATASTGARGPVPAAASRGRVEELNDPRSFMSFVSRYSIGDEVEAVVERFSSHGCYLRAASARCYLPSRAMGDPPPTRARDVVAQGQTIIVRVESLDADRRGINVALVRAVVHDGEISMEDRPRDPEVASARLRNPANPPHEPPVDADGSAREGNLTRSTTNVATTKPAKKTTARKSAATGAKKAAKATSSARVKKAVTKKAARTKVVAKKAATRKAATKKAATKKATRAAAPKKAATKKVVAKKAATKKATRAAAPKKAATKKAATRKVATAKKAPARKAAPRRTAGAK